MKERTGIIWQRALDSLEDATFNEEHNRHAVTVNRAYYAIFYAITALLNEQEFHTKSHSGAQAKFREIYVKTGRLPESLSEWLSQVWELRQSGDYDFDDATTEEEAVQALENARKFLESVKIYWQDNS